MLKLYIHFYYPSRIIINIILNYRSSIVYNMDYTVYYCKWLRSIKISSIPSIIVEKKEEFFLQKYKKNV